MIPSPLRRIAALWTAAVIAISLQPLRPSHSAKSLLHRPAHFLLFGLTAVILWLFFAAPPGRPDRAFPKALAFTILLGYFIELLQHLIYRNRMEWWDVRDDALSAVAALALLALARFLFVRPRAL